jgi:hypothetical protein
VYATYNKSNLAKLAIGAAAAVVLTIVPAIVHGRYTHRWGAAVDISPTAERLANLPPKLGAWTLVQEGEPLAENISRALGLAGYASRVYTNQTTGDVVTVLLMVGQSGRLVRHPPDICYASRANSQIGDAESFEVLATEPSSVFKLLEYERSERAAEERFLVAYGLTAGQIWSSPRYPRFAFGAAPYVCKLQMLTSLAPNEDRAVGRARLAAFANDFCPIFAQLEAGTSNP